MLIYVFTCLSLITSSYGETSKYYSMMKEIDGIIYIGGKNFLSSYELKDEKLTLITTENYQWFDVNMTGSDVGFNFIVGRWPSDIPKIPSSMSFDTCLNWKQENSNENVRSSSFDFQHWKYHTPSGDWNMMNFTCMNSFIKTVENLDENTLWVCGTFGAFPRAFSVNKTNLKFIKFVDVNMMSCARYMDEPMATYKDKINNKLYVASGWGLYRPDSKDPDIPDNNSTMLYADWRLYRNLFPLPSAMAWVLSSDVNFIKIVKDTDQHIYFFGYEVNNQYGLNNQEDRNAWQSFMLRIRKNDLGFKYLPIEYLPKLNSMTNPKYSTLEIHNEDYVLSPIHEHMSYNYSWYHNTVHLPTKHFVIPQKINFGCYIGKRPRAISDNYFWGETNVLFINKLVDVLFDPNRKIKFKTKNNQEYFGCNSESHSQLPMIGLFNKEGMKGTAIKPTGAICQLQINENIFYEEGSIKMPYHMSNLIDAKNAFEEIMFINSLGYSNSYSRSLHRTHTHSLNPFWNQGVLMGKKTENLDISNYFEKSNNETFYENMNKNVFLKIQNFTNTFWPNELANKLSSIPSAICQYSAAELYGFNASFIMPGVEFKRMFLIEDNYTNYYMHQLKNETESQRKSRLLTSPLLIVIIISECGDLYRVVLCDFDNGMANYGENQTLNEWYNWCIFRHSDQPYLYRQYAPMERKKWGESYQYRASSLLQERKVIKYSKLNDPNFHIVKEVLRKDNYLHILTSNNIHKVNIKINCNWYKTCINCASDPMCMWNVEEFKCINYDSSLIRNQYFLQDVLDRGFQCANVIKMYKVKQKIKLADIMVFHCSNFGFWRGEIVWKINEYNIDFQTMSSEISLHCKNNSITILKGFIDKFGNNISCYGKSNDNDKLFGGIEYDLPSIPSEILLNTLRIELAVVIEIGNSWKTAFEVLVSSFVIFLMGISIWVLFKNWNYLKLKIKSSKTNVFKEKIFPNPKAAFLKCDISTKGAWT